MSVEFSLNLRHLDALLAGARAGNMSAAASDVSLSQPALAHAVANMERALNTRLFDRHPTGVTPTEHGARFIARVARALRYLARGIAQVRRPARMQAIAHIERRITMGQLRALVSVVAVSSYAAAAAEVGISQPALHRAMRELQEITEIPMLVRVGRSVRPTDAAAKLVHFVRLMLAELAAGIDELAPSDETTGTIRIGVLPVARAHFLPQVLARFCEDYPGASIEVIEGPYMELLSRLRHGEMDLLIGSQRQSVPARDVRQEGLFDDELVIVGRAGHPLRDTARPSIDALLRYPWVVPARGVPMRLNWERMFHDRGREPPVLKVQCASVMIMRGLMLEGDWLTLMSRDQFLLESRAGKLVEIGTKGPGFWRRIAMTRRIEWQPTRLQSAFVALLQEMAARKTARREATGTGAI